MIFPDFAFGHDHRDYFSAAIKAQGGEVNALIPIPPTETSFTRYFPQIPADTEVIYHVMVGPAVLTFVKELGEHFGSQHPAALRLHRQPRGRRPQEPRPRIPRRLLFLGGLSALCAAPSPTAARHVLPREGGRRRQWRQRVATPRTSRPIRTCSAAGRRSTSSSRRWRPRATRARPTRPSWSRRPRRSPPFAEGNEHPQGDKLFNGKIHQVFGHQNITQVKSGVGEVVYRTTIEEGLYEPEADYTKMAL